MQNDKKIDEVKASIPAAPAPEPRGLDFVLEPEQELDLYQAFLRSLPAHLRRGRTEAIRVQLLELVGSKDNRWKLTCSNSAEARTVLSYCYWARELHRRLDRDNAGHMLDCLRFSRNMNEITVERTSEELAKGFAGMGIKLEVLEEK